jgi:hypothetical protein
LPHSTEIIAIFNGNRQRDKRAGALPGKSLVIYDPSQEMAIDVLPCEDGHAQERSLLDRVQACVEANDAFVMAYCPKNQTTISRIQSSVVHHMSLRPVVDIIVHHVANVPITEFAADDIRRLGESETVNLS